MRIRILAALVISAPVLAVAAAPATGAAPSPARHSHTGIQSVTAITKVYTYGQKVAAVAIEYSKRVDPRTLDAATFTVSDSIYNFRYNPVEDLSKRADRTVTRIYTNDSVELNASGRSTPGRYVIVELAPTDPGGNTVVVSKCPTFLCSVKVNEDQPTQVVQNEDVRAWSWLGRGRVLGEASSAAHSLSGRTVNLLVDEFEHRTFLRDGTALRYAYHLPARYNPRREYPLVVVLPGHGMGWDGDNLGVQLAADIPATAWLQPSWTGTYEDVIVLAPQNERVGAVAEAEIMADLVERFARSHRVDRDRIYASTVSYGSTLAWEAMASRPGLFAGALITGGFQVSADQAQRIATARTPIWVTHGEHDHLLPVTYGWQSAEMLRAAYVAAGSDPAEAQRLVRYTEYADAAFSEPDYHAAFGPTYEDETILRWLLAQA